MGFINFTGDKADPDEMAESEDSCRILMPWFSASSSREFRLVVSSFSFDNFSFWEDFIYYRFS